MSRTGFAGFLVAFLALAACNNPTTDFLGPVTSQRPAPGPIGVDSGAAGSILVDASHDGGVWWFPQVAPFDASSQHQGKRLADVLRGRGYQVEELGRGTRITREAMNGRKLVIRAGQYGAYTADEMAAYTGFVAAGGSVLLLGEFLRPGQSDELAKELGVSLTGWVSGTVTRFETHRLTADVASLPYIAGSVLAPGSSSVKPLGWLSTGEAVMGVVERDKGKVFFIGDTNGIQVSPSPLAENLLAWIS